MKLLFLYLLILVFKTTYSQKTDSIVDKRDGKTYKTVRIGNQIWMAENLAFKADSGCKEADPKNNSARAYGYIYHWRTARLACPEGWHLPYDDEWEYFLLTLQLTSLVQNEQNNDPHSGHWRCRRLLRRPAGKTVS